MYSIVPTGIAGTQALPKVRILPLLGLNSHSLTLVGQLRIMGAKAENV